MAYKISWTPEAVDTFDAIIRYLAEKWTEKEIILFLNKTHQLLNLISQYPEMFRSSSKRPVRIANITRQTNLFYQIKEA